MANNQIRIGTSKNETLIGWIWLLFQLFLLPRLLNWCNSALGYPISGAWVSFLYFCINFIVILCVFHRYLGASVSAMGRNLGRTLKAAFLSYCVYHVSNQAMGNLMGMLFPWFSNVNDTAVSDLLRLEYIPMLIGTVLLVPIAEEVLYRGVVFGSLYSRNHKLGYLLATAIFCTVHIIGYIGIYEPLTLALCFIQYIPAGLCLAWAYAEADNIFAPILVHIVVNALGVYAVR